MATHHGIGPRFIASLTAVALAVVSSCNGDRADSAASDGSGSTATAKSDWVAPPTDSALESSFPADTPTAASAPTPAARRPPAPTRVATPTPPQGTAPRGGTTASGAGPAAGRPPTPPASATAPAAGAARDTTPPRDTAVATTTTAPPAATAGAPGAPAPIPPRAFAVGERLTYDVHFGPIRVGQASMEVLGLEQLRGRDVYHTRFTVRGGTPFYRVNDRYESWFDARTMESLRYAQEIDQGSYERERLFDIYPERRTFTEAGRPEHQPSVADPLDDGSFLYFLRTIPLEVGKSYEFNRYFRPDRNPVRVTVLRRDRVRVPAGTFEAIVVRPTIKTRGIFSEGGRAEVWFAADSTRRMLQMKSRLSFGTLTLYLRRVEP